MWTVKNCIWPFHTKKKKFQSDSGTLSLASSWLIYIKYELGEAMW